MTKRLSDLTEDTSPSSDDFILSTDNATSASKKVTLNKAVNAGLPTQSGNSGKFLTSDGSTTSWDDPTGLFPAGGDPGAVLQKATTTDGDVDWEGPNVTPTFSKLGMNIGNDIDGGTGTYPTAQRAADLLILRRYVSRLRVKIEYHQDTVGVGYSKTLALAAKAMGFYVSWGITSGGGGAGISRADYVLWRDTSMPAAALWAYQNGIDEFQIGNEEDLWADSGGIASTTAANVRTDVLAAAVTLKAAYPNMRIVYSTAEGEVLGWDAAGTGQLDGLGFNIYNSDFSGTVLYFKTLSFSDKMFISEWNYTSGYTASGLSAAAYRAEVKARLEVVRDYDMPAYFYTWRDPTDDWAIRLAADTYNPGWEELVGLDTAATTQWRHPFVRPHSHPILDIDGLTSALDAAGGGGSLGSEIDLTGVSAVGLHVGVASTGTGEFGTNVDKDDNIDDITKPQWRSSFSNSSDVWRIQRSPAGATFTPVTEASLSNLGKLTLLGGVVTRVTTIASSATPTLNADTDDMLVITALAAGATFAAPTGTPADGQKFMIRVKDNATPRALAFNAAFRFSTSLTAPTTTVASKWLYMGFIYNGTDSKYDCLAILNNF